MARDISEGGGVLELFVSLVMVADFVRCRKVQFAAERYITDMNLI